MDWMFSRSKNNSGCRAAALQIVGHGPLARFWSRFSLKTMHYFCVFLFVRVILWKFSFSAKSTSSVYVVIYIPDEFLWTWKFFHRIFWNLENILNTFIDLVSLIFMEIWSTLAKLLPKKKQFCCRKSLTFGSISWEQVDVDFTLY